MFCTHCGARLAPGDAFCSVCGAETAHLPPRPGRNGVLWAGVLVLVLVLVVGTGAWLLTRTSSSGHDPASSPARSEPSDTPRADPSPSTTSPSPTPSASPSELTFPALYRQSSDGVVRVETTACDGGGVGSGFLIAPTLVATVAHVVQDGVSIVLRQGSTITTGTVIGIDPDSDLALVRAGRSLPGHVFSLDHAEPEVGTDVAAIGYPLGGPESLTKGSISGLGRTIHVEGNTLDDLIQTDAGVNPGNSGGPLVDTTGTVVGLVDAKETDASGIAYAIPAATAMRSFDGWSSNPREVSPGAGCETPTAPDDVSVGMRDHSGSPDGPAVADLFTTYANAINTGDYSTAFDQLTPAARDRVGLDDFATGNTSSFLISFDIDDVTPSGSGREVRARFTSVQDSSMGHSGQTCSEWTMTYALVADGDTFLIDHAAPDDGSPNAC